MSDRPKETPETEDTVSAEHASNAAGSHTAADSGMTGKDAASLSGAADAAPEGSSLPVHQGENASDQLAPAATDESDAGSENTVAPSEVAAVPTDGDTPTAPATPSSPLSDTDVPFPPPPFPFETEDAGNGDGGTDDSDNADAPEGALPAVPGETAPAAQTAPEDEEDSGEEEDEDEEDEDESPMTLIQHLDELRRRLKYVAFAAIIGCLACYGFAEQLFALLVAPMTQFMPAESRFIFTAPQEAFVTYLKVSALAGIFLTSPVIFYQIWSFVAPGLYEEERRYIIPIALCSAIFFVSGAAFGYFVVFPAAFEFFMSFNTEHIQAMLKLDEYLGFSIKLLLAFGFVFEMPLFALILGRIGLITAEMMRRWRRFAVLGAFIVGAILTPPDVFSQLLMAGPLLVLYELSIILVASFGRKRAEPEDEEEDEEEDEDNDETTDGDDSAETDQNARTDSAPRGGAA